jgi:hypothetical protein
LSDKKLKIDHLKVLFLGYSHTTSSSSTASSGGVGVGMEAADFGAEDEARLRDYISQLKVRYGMDAAAFGVENFGILSHS